MLVHFQCKVISNLTRGITTYDETKTLEVSNKKPNHVAEK